MSFTPRACLSCTSLHINVLFAGPKSTDLKEIMPAVRKLLPKDYFSLGEVLPTAEPAASAASWESHFTSPRVGNQNCGIASKNITAQHKETALRRTTTAQDCSGRCLLTCCQHSLWNSHPAFSLKYWICKSLGKTACSHRSLHCHFR